MRSATGGDAAKAIKAPMPAIAIKAARFQRSMVHHQRAIGAAETSHTSVSSQTIMKQRKYLRAAQAVPRPNGEKHYRALQNF